MDIAKPLDDELMRMNVTVRPGWKNWVVRNLQSLADGCHREPQAWKVTFIGGNTRYPGEIDADVIFACFGDQCRVQLRVSKYKIAYFRRRYLGGIVELGGDYAKLLLGIDLQDSLPDPVEIRGIWSKFLVASGHPGLPETPPDPVLLCTADVKQYSEPARRVLVDVPICPPLRRFAKAALIWPKATRGKLWQQGGRITVDRVQPGDLLEVAAYDRSSGAYEAWYGLVVAITPVFLGAIPIPDKLLVEITQQYPGYAKRGIRVFRVLGAMPARVMVRALGEEIELPLRELSFKAVAGRLGLREEGLLNLLRVYKQSADAARVLVVL